MISDTDPSATGTTGIAILSRLPSTLVGKLPVGKVLPIPCASGARCTSSSMSTGPPSTSSASTSRRGSPTGPRSR